MDISQPGTTVRCWVDLYTDPLYTWAFYKTNHKELAEDLVQETFIAAFQSMEKFAGKSEVKTWLFAILNNKIAEHFRKQFRNPASKKETEFADFFDTEGGWLPNQRPGQWTETDSHLLDDPEFKETLAACLEKLPPHWNAALQLKYLEDKKGETICQELGITPTNFWQVLHRAKLQVRKCLENHWFKK